MPQGKLRLFDRICRLWTTPDISQARRYKSSGVDGRRTVLWTRTNGIIAQRSNLVRPTQLTLPSAVCSSAAYRHHTILSRPDIALEGLPSLSSLKPGLWVSPQAHSLGVAPPTRDSYLSESDSLDPCTPQLSLHRQVETWLVNRFCGSPCLLPLASAVRTLHPVQLIFTPGHELCTAALLLRQLYLPVVPHVNHFT
ncbi:hypothetical protein BD310DRAFT_265589 [Dichomitus squalens]|uniref:Uncharacterized protein n=1 Tax=Dichomitus squalens TaxID=114155 RepID=A0A4Q9Q0R3_9APHY|nr:hypothetical protein BD310DRAFT_265589 [Dichomitus squalens]